MRTNRKPQICNVEFIYKIIKRENISYIKNIAFVQSKVSLFLTISFSSRTSREQRMLLLIVIAIRSKKTSSVPLCERHLTKEFSRHRCKL